MDNPPKPAETWAVYHQDDHGNFFTVEVGLSRKEAEQLVAGLGRRGHK